jgi:hypothetical protein
MLVRVPVRVPVMAEMESWDGNAVDGNAVDGKL